MGGRFAASRHLVPIPMSQMDRQQHHKSSGQLMLSEESSRKDLYPGSARDIPHVGENHRVLEQ